MKKEKLDAMFIALKDCDEKEDNCDNCPLFNCEYEVEIEHPHFAGTIKIQACPTIIGLVNGVKAK